MLDVLDVHQAGRLQQESTQLRFVSTRLCGGCQQDHGMMATKLVFSGHTPSFSPVHDSMFWMSQQGILAAGCCRRVLPLY